MRARRLCTFIVLAAALWLPSLASAQGTVMPVPRQVFLDNNGNPCASCKVYTYDAGTTNARAVYSDVTLLTTLPNPFTLNGSGRPQTNVGTETNVYLSATSYKFVLTTSAGVTIWTADNVTAVPTTSGNLDVTGTAGEALAAGEVVYLSGTDGRWYRADADVTTSSSTAGIVGIAPSAISSAAEGSIRLQGRVTALSGLTAGELYYASATAGALTATPPTNARFVGEADSTTSIVVSPNPGAVRLPDSDGSHHYVLRTSDNLAADQVITLPFNWTLPCQGRLTASTGVPVTETDVTAATSIFYTPAVGSLCAVYDGSATWTTLTFTQLTISVSSCTANTPYDVFLYNNSGTLAAEILAWTNTTTRATALVQQNGVWVKTGATTRRWAGSFHCNSSGGQTDDSERLRFICNAENRVLRSWRFIETTDSWTYTTATWRQWRATATNQLEALICHPSGAGKEAISIVLKGIGSNDTGRILHSHGIGRDSTSAPTTLSVLNNISADSVTINVRWSTDLTMVEIPPIGYHYWAALEYSEAAGAGTFYGDAGAPTQYQAGMVGLIRN